MTLMALLLALQAAQDPDPPDESLRRRSGFRFGPVAQYWFPRFRGTMREDGTSTPGTTLRLADDLNLPRNPSIPIYGGGEIGAYMIERNPRERYTFTGVAEYWAHTWNGHDVLKSTERVEDQVFTTGSSVESRFRLSCLTLDLQGTFTEGWIVGGLCLSLQIRSATLRMNSPTVQVESEVTDALWGGGLFVEYRPIPYLLVGGSLKAFTPFGNGTDCGAGDFRIYGGVAWGPLRLEGGARSVVYDFDGADESLGYSLNGAYVQVSLIVNF